MEQIYFPFHLPFNPNPGINLLVRKIYSIQPAYLHPGDTIFRLIGFNDDRRSGYVFKRYIELKKKTMPINIATKPDAVDHLAERIFRELQRKFINSRNHKIVSVLRASANVPATYNRRW